MIRILIALALVASTQTALEQPREATQAGYSIRGLVVDAHSGVPVRRARVDAESAGGDRVTTVSDAQGRFVLRDMPEGRHHLTVSKPGYLPSSYGQVRPGGPGIALDVPRDLTDNDLNVTIFRGGVIPGRVVDERGDPVPMAQVRAVQYQFAHGSRRLSWAAAQGSNPFTDDLGGFRLYGLPPGRYVVVASAGAMHSPGSPLPPNTPAPELRLPLMTYFPNTTESANALPIVVSAGKESPAITITLGSGRPVRVRGRVFRSTGEPFEGGVSASPNEGYVAIMTAGSSIRPDGSFDLMRVLPGSYVLTALDRSSGTSKNQEVGYAVVSVGTDNVDDVLIVTGKPGIARGRMVTEDGSPVPRSVAPISVTTVQASGPDRVWRSNGPTRLKDDATFELDGLVGAHTFQVATETQRDWVLASAWRGDQEITDTGVSFGPNDVIENITLVVTRTRNELSGTVMDASGRPTADAWVIVFPADASLWKWPRWVRATQTDRRGEFRVETLPAHDHYLLATLPYGALDDSEMRDPETLTALRSRAVEIAVGAAEKKVVQLRVGTP